MNVNIDWHYIFICLSCNMFIAQFLRTIQFWAHYISKFQTNTTHFPNQNKILSIFFSYIFFRGKLNIFWGSVNWGKIEDLCVKYFGLLKMLWVGTDNLWSLKNSFYIESDFVHKSRNDLVLIFGHPVGPCFVSAAKFLMEFF